MNVDRYVNFLFLVIYEKLECKDTSSSREIHSESMCIYNIILLFYQCVVLNEKILNVKIGHICEQKLKSPNKLSQKNITVYLISEAVWSQR